VVYQRTLRRFLIREENGDETGDESDDEDAEDAEECLFVLGDCRRMPVCLREGTAEEIAGYGVEPALRMAL